MKKVKDAFASYKEAGVSLAYLQIAQDRARPTKDETKGVMFWSLSSAMDPVEAAALNRSLMEVCQHLGGEVKQGGAPPSPAERKLKQDIANLKKTLGKV